ncbi:hypothetical protein C2857_002626 [Epichloe festucae Fl1]|uniref:DNA damage-responsive protein 48 n=1 Tax=Epichloe festucae (strain Fl1) TaxID=877507 RepID=A0A7U3Q2X2_EPIFF|nr:hypothetical protein C2857_002626 [Epichloe festucae Fl1]
MDFLKKMSDGVGGDTKESTNNSGESQNSGVGSMFKDKLNGMAGGGKQGEENEDGLDKAVDFVQEKFLGEGDQSNESAAEQAKDEAISDFIRDKYKTTTGKDFFIPDKEKKFGV